jgi:3-oxoacyl-[acyl-carrier protein] reductase
VIDPGLRGKVVLVTGGNSPRGIGAATARAFAAQGAAVFVHFFRPIQIRAGDGEPTTDPGTPRGDGEATYAALQRHPADALVAEIRAAGGPAAAWEADLADPDAARVLLDRAEAALGPVEVLSTTPPTANRTPCCPTPCSRRTRGRLTISR